MAMTGRAGMKLRPATVLKFSTYRDGHKHVTLSRDGQTRTFQVHALVLRAFVGPYPPGMQIRHLNGTPHDNRLENLTYGTPAENARDRDEVHGTNYELNRTHCPQGHPYDKENTYIAPSGHRQCRTCRAERNTGECSQDECINPGKSRGLCSKHYAAWRRANLSEEKLAELRERDARQARERRSLPKKKNN
jgi:hypothetical protein